MDERVLHVSRPRADDYLNRDAADAPLVREWPRVTTRLRPERKAALRALCFAKGLSMDEAVERCIEWAWAMLVAYPAREVRPLARPNRRRRRGGREGGGEGQHDGHDGPGTPDGPEQEVPAAAERAAQDGANGATSSA